MYTSLSINDLQLKVNLGASEKERARKQTVMLNIDIIFSTPPKACKTDAIADSVCYDEMIVKIRKFCIGKEYSLIEHLGHQLHQFIKKNIPSGCRLYLMVEKKPPIPNLRSCSFSIEE